VGDAPLSFLWLIDLEPRAGMQHGGALRWFNYSRELIARGHRVCFSVNQDPGGDAEEKRRFLEARRAEGRLSAYSETSYRFPRFRGKLAHLLAYPGLTNLVLRPFQARAAAAVEAALSAHRVDVVVISDRRLLFLAPRLRGRVAVLLDWSDSVTLYEWRQAVVHWRRGELRKLPQSLKRLLQAILQERYYGRRSDANVLVSPVDLRVFGRVSGREGSARLLLNGIELPASRPGLDKIPGRLVFTGAMSFAPNFEAAIWFIDHVLPLILRRRPEARFVVAGRDPVPELVRRAGPHVEVTGPVPDMREEIARSALYVAPLVSGGGFKNKVIEALAAGTFVAGTSMAVEFLPESLRDELLVGDTPAELADRVVGFLETPAAFAARIPGLAKGLADEYAWSRRTDQLLEIVEDGRYGT
jgi:glycosyltransferase involved in cell wall biosynthesis